MSKKNTVISEIEQYRIDTVKSLLLQDLYNKQNLIEDKSAIEEKINEVLKRKNNTFEFKCIIEKTNLFDISDRIIFPAPRKGKLISEVHISKIEFNKPFELYDADEEENDPFFMHSRYAWKSASIILMLLDKDENLIIYTEDCNRYKFSFSENPILHLFDE